MVICYGTLLLSVKSRHRAKASVCFSKQRGQSEDRDGDFMSKGGLQACQQIKRKPMFASANSELQVHNLRRREERNVDAKSVSDVASK